MILLQNWVIVIIKVVEVIVLLLFTYILLVILGIIMHLEYVGTVLCIIVKEEITS